MGHGDGGGAAGGREARDEARGRDADGTGAELGIDEPAGS
jgi:hypothetical protein